MRNGDRQRSWIRFLIPYSLKGRLFLIILLTTLIPLLLIGITSYYSIYHILQNKVEKTMRSNLEQHVTGLESILDNLDFASRQLAFEGAIGSNLRVYLSTDNPLDKSFIMKDIRSYMTLINYTNPKLGLMEYFLEDDGLILQPELTYKTDKLSLDQYPILLKRNGITFYGPHPSIYSNSKDLVISAVRRVGDFGLSKAIEVYIETNYSVLRDSIITPKYGINVRHILLNEANTVVYSGDEGRFDLGEVMTVAQLDEAELIRGRLLFSTTAEHAWKLIAVVEPKEFREEITSWLQRFLILGFLSLAGSVLLAGLIWRMIYRPLGEVKREIQQMGSIMIHEPIPQVGILEFDDLLKKFQSMKVRIAELIIVVESKERNKRHLEVEKLMYQINPHFIHNTLNTAQWLAMMNGQDEIVELLATFTRLLNYNLGKEGGMVVVKSEIEALTDYVKLQQIRYNYKFAIEYDLDEEAMECVVPRFILQPLVENALYHGFKTHDGVIRVVTRREGRYLLLRVEDNGSGMTVEQIEKLLDNENLSNRNAGLGIGLGFVDNIIKVNYGDAYGLKIVSELGKGTAMILTIPIHQRGEVT